MAKYDHIPALMTIKANAQGISAPPGDYSLSVFLDGLGATWGDILYRGSTGWVALSPQQDCQSKKCYNCPKCSEHRPSENK